MEWKIIKEFPNYVIDLNGDVLNLTTGEIIKECKMSKSDYLYVKIFYKNKSYLRSVHRLLLMTFNPVENMNTLDVNHINGIKDDNRLENLEWMTRSENCKHAYDIGLINRIGEDNGRVKLSNSDAQLIKMIFESDEFKKNKITLRFMGKKFGVTYYCILDILKGKTWNHIKIDNDDEELNKKLKNFLRPENLIGAENINLSDRNYLAKLTTNDIIEVKKMLISDDFLNGNLNYEIIGKLFNVTGNTIYRIHRNKTWKHIKI